MADRIALPDLNVPNQVNSAGVGLINAFASDLFDFIDRGLKKTKGIATYARTQKEDPNTKQVTDHLESVAPEGFVMIDTGTGKALKAVNRSEFSKMNFERGKMAQMKRAQQAQGEDNG